MSNRLTEIGNKVNQIKESAIMSKSEYDFIQNDINQRTLAMHLRKLVQNKKLKLK